METATLTATFSSGESAIRYADFLLIGNHIVGTPTVKGTRVTWDIDLDWYRKTLVDYPWSLSIRENVTYHGGVSFCGSRISVYEKRACM